MANKINIMLILVLGVTSSWGQKLLYISDPMEVDIGNIVYQPAPQLPGPVSLTDVREAALLQPDWSQRIPIYQGRGAVFNLEQGRKANRLEYGLNTIPQKKSSDNESTKQYAWNIEDRLWLEKETNIKKDTGVYPNAGRGHRQGTYVKFLHFMIQNLNSSIHRVGAHYWIVAGPK
jgi:hypothetical protein